MHRKLLGTYTTQSSRASLSKPFQVCISSSPTVPQSLVKLSILVINKFIFMHKILSLPKNALSFSNNDFM